MAKPIATKGWRSAAFVSSYLLSPDFFPLPVSTFSTFWGNRQMVYNLAKITKEIDDAVDGMPPSKVAAEDFSIGPNGLCRFLENTNYVPTAYMENMNRLVDVGVITKDASIGYSNLFCLMIKDRADVQVALEKTASPEVRLAMATNNLRFASVFGCLFFGLSKPMAEGYFAERGGVTFDSVREAYPNIYTINALGQMLDDMRDVIIDLNEEVETLTVSPNIFLANAMTTPDARAEILSFQRDVSLSGAKEVHMGDLPRPLKKSFDTVGAQFANGVDEVRSAVSRVILGTFWRNTSSEGFKTSAALQLVRA